MDEIDTKVSNCVLQNFSKLLCFDFFEECYSVLTPLQVDKATSDLKSTNVRLKDTVNQVH